MDPGVGGTVEPGPAPAVGATFVCLGGLLTRVLPDVFPIAPNVLDQRLSYPITYWNGVGLLYVRKQPVAGAATFRERLAPFARLQVVVARAVATYGPASHAQPSGAARPRLPCMRPQPSKSMTET
mgnify:CR=1 FL=1